MKSFNVLPADTYTIFNKTIINQEDKKLFLYYINRLLAIQQYPYIILY